jgi:hypothetical protein
MRIFALLTRLSFTPQVLLTATSAKTEMVPETSTSLQKDCEVQNSSVRPPLVCNIKNELIQLAGEVGLLSVGRGGDDDDDDINLRPRGMVTHLPKGIRTC